MNSPNPPHDDQADAVTGVLKNLLGLTHSDELSKAAREFAFARILQLSKTPLLGQFDATHLRAIHRFVFQDVFPWAGEFRTVMTARGDSFGFPPPIYIAQSLADTFQKLRDERHLTGLDHDAFATRAAYFLGELNAVHAFRDGNGRAQREFIRTLAFHAGHRLVWSGLGKQENDAASRLSFAHGDNSGLVTIIRRGLV